MEQLKDSNSFTEEHLNRRLDETVQDYLYNEKSRTEYQKRFNENKISRTCYFETMEMIDSLKWTILRRLELQVRRLTRRGYEVRNEVALQLYDELRGNHAEEDKQDDVEKLIYIANCIPADWFDDSQIIKVCYDVLKVFKAKGIDEGIDSFSIQIALKSLGYCD